MDLLISDMALGGGAGGTGGTKAGKVTIDLVSRDLLRSLCLGGTSLVSQPLVVLMPNAIILLYNMI